MTKPRNLPDTTTYLLRDVPDAVWLRARSKAVLERKSIREVIIELLDEWADQPTTKRATPTARKRR